MSSTPTNLSTELDDSQLARLRRLRALRKSHSPHDESEYGHEESGGGGGESSLVSSFSKGWEQRNDMNEADRFEPSPLRTSPKGDSEENIHIPVSLATSVDVLRNWISSKRWKEDFEWKRDSLFESIEYLCRFSEDVHVQYCREQDRATGIEKELEEMRKELHLAQEQLEIERKVSIGREVMTRRELRQLRRMTPDPKRSTSPIRDDIVDEKECILPTPEREWATKMRDLRDTIAFLSKEVDDLRHERNELFTCLDELQMSSVLPLIDIQDDEEAAEGDVASCSYLERIRSLAHVFRDQNQLIHKLSDQLLRQKESNSSQDSVVQELEHVVSECRREMHEFNDELDSPDTPSRVESLEQVKVLLLDVAQSFADMQRKLSESLESSTLDIRKTRQLLDERISPLIGQLKEKSEQDFHSMEALNTELCAFQLSASETITQKNETLEKLSVEVHSTLSLFQEKLDYMAELQSELNTTRFESTISQRLDELEKTRTDVEWKYKQTLMDKIEKSLHQIESSLLQSSESSDVESSNRLVEQLNLSLSRFSDELHQHEEHVQNVLNEAVANVCNSIQRKATAEGTEEANVFQNLIQTFDELVKDMNVTMETRHDENIEQWRLFQETSTKRVEDIRKSLASFQESVEDQMAKNMNEDSSHVQNLMNHWTEAIQSLESTWKSSMDSTNESHVAYIQAQEEAFAHRTAVEAQQLLSLFSGRVEDARQAIALSQSSSIERVQRAIESAKSTWASLLTISSDMEANEKRIEEESSAQGLAYQLVEEAISEISNVYVLSSSDQTDNVSADHREEKMSSLRHHLFVLFSLFDEKIRSIYWTMCNKYRQEAESAIEKMELEVMKRNKFVENVRLSSERRERRLRIACSKWKLEYEANVERKYQCLVDDLEKRLEKEVSERERDRTLRTEVEAFDSFLQKSLQIDKTLGDWLLERKGFHNASETSDVCNGRDESDTLQYRDNLSSSRPLRERIRSAATEIRRLWSLLEADSSKIVHFLSMLESAIPMSEAIAEVYEVEVKAMQEYVPLFEDIMEHEYSFYRLEEILTESFDPKRLFELTIGSYDDLDRVRMQNTEKFVIASASLAGRIEKYEQQMNIPLFFRGNRFLDRIYGELLHIRDVSTGLHLFDNLSSEVQCALNKLSDLASTTHVGRLPAHHSTITRVSSPSSGNIVNFPRSNISRDLSSSPLVLPNSISKALSPPSR